jgi:hypothetical protein
MWSPADTTTHQDHVIAHVIGATVLAYFILDETVFLLLDIGFIWHVYLDGEMGLRPHPVAVSELDADSTTKQELQSSIDTSLQLGTAAPGRLLKSSPNMTPIASVDFFVRQNSRRLVLTCEAGNIVVETTLETSEVTVMGKTGDSENASDLTAAALEEREFVRNTLSSELGREPTEEEVNEWLREHTESY